jgi:hypothetical protein
MRLKGPLKRLDVAGWSWLRLRARAGPLDEELRREQVAAHIEELI